MGVLSIDWWLLIPFLLVAAFEWLRLRGTGPRLILEEFKVRSDETDGEFLYILGRRAGLVGWLMAIAGLQSQTSFSVTRFEVARDTMGPGGYDSVYAPIAHVVASRCSFYHAFGVLLLSIGFLVYGLVDFTLAALASDDYAQQQAMQNAGRILWLCILVGGLSYLWYVLTKRVVVSVTTAGHVRLGIAFRRAIGGSATADLRDAIGAVDLVNARLLGRSEQYY